MRIFCSLLLAFNVGSFGQAVPSAPTPAPAPQTSEATPQESKPIHAEGSVTPPSVVSSVAPTFTKEERKEKFTGNVRIHCWVDEQGNPSHVRVDRGVRPDLDEKAVEAVKQYKFKPATKNGKPVKVDLYIEVNFHIY